MSTTFGERVYPFEDFAIGDGFACFPCYPQIHIRTECKAATRSKVGFVEFTAPSDPPRRFLRSYTLFRCYISGAGTTLAWENTAIDPVTGEGTLTSSTPEYTSCPAAGYNEVVTTTPTMQRTVWTRYGGDGEIESRLERIVTLSAEYTTEQLISGTEGDVALEEWAETFPAEQAESCLRQYSYAGPLYYPGFTLWHRASGLITPNWRQLYADELMFQIQLVRYVVMVPPLLGAGSTFTVEWDEVFVPEDAESEDDWEIVANCAMTGGAADPESLVLELTERREDGEVFVMNARYTALAGAP